MLSEDVREMLEAEGATVVGPVARLAAAIALAESDSRIDGALLDVNLQGEMVFPLADLLRERNIPFLFATGYDAEAIPPRFAQTKLCDKPLNADQVCRALTRIMVPDIA
jgi:CheY-like chemotaxis protein